MASFIEKQNTTNNKRLIGKNQGFLKKKPKLIETDDGKEIVDKIFNEFLELKKIKRYSR